jgi:hypothetical protein
MVAGPVDLSGEGGREEGRVAITGVLSSHSAKLLNPWIARAVEGRLKGPRSTSVGEEIREKGEMDAHKSPE